MMSMRKAAYRPEFYPGDHNPAVSPERTNVSGAKKASHSGFFDTRKGKRSLEEMVESLGGDPVKEAAYVLERVYNIEKSIVNVLMAISEKGRAIAYQRRPSLKRYH